MCAVLSIGAFINHTRTRKLDMKRLCMCAVLSIGAFINPAAFADQDKPVNAMCPIGKEPIVASAGTVEYKGHTIGICCPGCGKAFLAWNESRRDDFVAIAMLGKEPGHAGQPQEEQAAAPQPAEPISFSYPLDVCIVSGGKLGSMGDPIVKKYDGREVRFCCAGCIGRFEADKAGYVKKIDELIVKDQMRYYPTDKCIVSGEPLVEDGKDIATNMVFQNRLVRLCCKSCERQFKASPKKFIEILDKAVADTQRKDYPLETCVVLGGPLGSMGEPTEMVVAGRLLRFCCVGCEPKVIADPVKYLAAIDKAWQAKKGKFKPAPDSANQSGHNNGGE